MALEANSTFLPVLDDLLSPDFRPVLQTPTTEVGGLGGGGGYNNNYGRGFSGFPGTSTSTSTVSFVPPPNINQRQAQGQGPQIPPQHKNVETKVEANQNSNIGNNTGIITPSMPEHDASLKIQNWWRRNKGAAGEARRKSTGQIDYQAIRVKHSIRHNRTEEHIQYLEGEVNRLKLALGAERKLRSLQLDAIRSLWSQVQKISTTTGESPIMTQSMPNGLGGHGTISAKAPEGTMSSSFHCGGGGDSRAQGPNDFGNDIKLVPTCSTNCTREIQELKESMANEIAGLRRMIESLTLKHSSNKDSNDSSVNEKENEGGSTLVEGEQDNQGSLGPQAQRPLTLNLPGTTQQGPCCSSNLNRDNPKESSEEIRGFANDMASQLLEHAVEKEPKDS